MRKVTNLGHTWQEIKTVGLFAQHSESMETSLVTYQI